MLSILLLATTLAIPATQSESQLQSVYISHEGDDSLGIQFVAELRELLKKRGLRLVTSESTDHHTLVVLSIRAVNERTSRQLGSVVSLALLRPDDTFVKMWVYTLNHTSGHVRRQVSDFISDLVQVKSGLFEPVD